MNCRIDWARDDGEAGTQMFASNDEAKEAARGDASQRCTTWAGRATARLR
jgi:hypothetical protein